MSRIILDTHLFERLIAKWLTEKILPIPVQEFVNFLNVRRYTDKTIDAGAKVSFGFMYVKQGQRVFVNVRSTDVINVIYEEYDDIADKMLIEQKIGDRVKDFCDEINPSTTICRIVLENPLTTAVTVNGCAKVV